MTDVPQDVDFNSIMQKWFGMDEDAIEKLLDSLDADDLDTLNDAVAKGDKARAQQAIGKVHAEEEDSINSLFKHIEDDDNDADEEDKKTKSRPNAHGRTQFAIGDDVMVRYRTHDGKVKRVSATVAQTDGPEGSKTIVVSIKGKRKVIDKKNVERIDEGILGMVAVPGLQRMQQLAGIQAETIVQPADQSEPEPVVEPVQQQASCPATEAMAALDALAAALPNVRVADLKTIRSRMTELQNSLFESIQHTRSMGRNRKPI